MVFNKCFGSVFTCSRKEDKNQGGGCKEGWCSDGVGPLNENPRPPFALTPAALSALTLFTVVRGERIIMRNSVSPCQGEVRYDMSNEIFKYIV